LEGMEPRTKTFIRQRCYSAGSIVDDALSSKPKSESDTTNDPKSKPTLRYLIHINICCTSKGRYFLYQSIRVVFANRVPDGKEKLQNEIQLPEPRYSAYKVNRDTSNASGSSAGAKLTAEKAYRRRSLGFGFGGPDYEKTDGVSSQPFAGRPTFSFSTTPQVPVPPIPFNLVRSREAPVAAPEPAVIIPDKVTGTAFDADSDLSISPLNNRALSRMDSSLTSSTGGMSSSYRSNSSHSSDSYNKLSKGDAGYGGIFGNKVNSPDIGDGLLARRLKGLGVQRAEDEGST